MNKIEVDYSNLEFKKKIHSFEEFLLNQNLTFKRSYADFTVYRSINRWWGLIPYSEYLCSIYFFKSMAYCNINDLEITKQIVEEYNKIFNTTEFVIEVY